MSGTKPVLTPLESRKRLLLVESELNRVQLLNELRGFKYELRPLTQQMHIIHSFFSSLAGMAGAFAAIRQVLSHRQNDGEAKPSLIFTLFNGLRRSWRSRSK
jgi:hypothetical protein